MNDDNGGIVIDYAIRMLQLKKAGTPVRVSGSCMSACTLILALPAEQICVTEQASFGFHRPYGTSGDGIQTAKDYLYDSYPVWVKAWLRQRGGLSAAMKVMNFSFTKKFLKVCPEVGTSSDMAYQGNPSPPDPSIY